jgi:hypothetical protein
VRNGLRAAKRGSLLVRGFAKYRRHETYCHGFVVRFYKFVLDQLTSLNLQGQIHTLIKFLSARVYKFTVKRIQDSRKFDGSVSGICLCIFRLLSPVSHATAL